ncbi:cyclase family protein [Chachezhania antarctica]|uniref:cyclase family protein n=1 Tax=Chachezhania antarctica TaxID=2340860 RepID=UPI000EB481CB|nr:cyclase family protein [Chachezhania antarctica]|tara:strand:- start:3892 stop:4830 length:939 start_codon:yes stop_codon:yes gene_type:complete
MTKTLIAGLACAMSICAGTAWAQDCEPSPWGADDQLGSANLVTPERTLEALKLVKQGKSVPLGITIDPSTPAFPPRSLSLQIVQPGQQGGQRVFGDGVYNDDILQTWIGIGSQIDGLGHVGEGGMYYNCNDEKEFAQLTGLTKLGTHAIPPLVGRAVILDMAKQAGKTTLDAGESFGEAEIKAAADAQGVTFAEGDIILFYTGWTDAKLDSDPAAWGSAEPGINNEGARYVASLKPMAVGADTWGVEPVPPAEGDGLFYGHTIFLKQNGVYLLENMNTGPILQDGVNEFMFVLGQPRIRGTVQAMINPVALY